MKGLSDCRDSLNMSCSESVLIVANRWKFTSTQSCCDVSTNNQSERKGGIDIDLGRVVDSITHASETYENHNGFARLSLAVSQAMLN